MARLRLEIDENVTEWIDCAATQPTGIAQSLAGWTLRFVAKDAGGVSFIDKSSADPTQIEISDVNGGLFTVHILPANTLGKSGLWTCECRAVDGFGNAYKFFQGQLLINPSTI